MPSERRLHPLSIVFGLIPFLRAVAVPALLLFLGVSTTGWEPDFGDFGRNWEYWAILLVIPYGFAATARYLGFRYRYEAHEIVIRTGLVFRNERHVPYARIQNLDAVQGPLHRLLGVVEVRLETGAGQEPEAVLRVLPFAAFEELRQRTFEGKASGKAAELDAEGVRRAGEPDAAGLADSTPEPDRTLLQLPPGELMLYGFIQNRGLVVAAAGFGFLVQTGVVDAFFGRVFNDDLAQIETLGDLPKALFGRGLTFLQTAFLLALLAGLLLAVRVLSMAWALVRLHGFRLSRVGEDLRTEYGLLTRVLATIPLHRIQTLRIREGLLHRLSRRAALQVETAGAADDEGAKTRKEWLVPLVRRAELPRLVAAVFPGLDLATLRWQGVHPRAFRRRVTPKIVLYSLLALFLSRWIGGWAWGLLGVMLSWAMVSAYLYVAYLGWALTDGAVLFRRGWLRREIRVVPFAKVQSVVLFESPFDRRREMLRLRVDVAAASRDLEMPYLGHDTGWRLQAHLAAQAAETTFRW